MHGSWVISITVETKRVCTHGSCISHENNEYDEQNNDETNDYVPLVSSPNQNSEHLPGVCEPIERGFWSTEE